MEEDEKLLSEPLQIPTLVKDIKVCIETLDKTQKCIYRTEYEDIVKQGRFQLLSIITKIKAHDCRKTSYSLKEDIERDIFMANTKSEMEEVKIAHIRKEWTQQQKSMAKLQECVYKKCRLLSLHSSYCSSQGSALCSILALMMGNPELVEAFLTEPDTYLVSFIKIADGLLFSFIRAYAINEPLEDSTDYKYILALYTCISHISDLVSGRQFLIKQEECQLMLAEIVCILPNVNHSTAKTLKLILIKILHDVMVEDEGRRLLCRFPELLDTLNVCMCDDYDPKSHTQVIMMLDRITSEIPTKEFLDKVVDKINTSKLKEFTARKYKEVNIIAKKILQNINAATEEFLRRQAQGDGPQSQPKSPCRCKDKSKSKPASPHRSRPASPKKAKTKQIIRLPREHSGGRVCTRQRFKSTENVRPTSESATSYSSTSTVAPTPPRSPEGRSRPCTRRSSAYKPLNLCSTPCRNMFLMSAQESRQNSAPNGHPRPHSAGDRSSFQKTPTRQSSLEGHKRPSCEATKPPTSREQPIKSVLPSKIPKPYPQKQPCGTSCSAPCGPQSRGNKPVRSASSCNKPTGSSSGEIKQKHNKSPSGSRVKLTCKPSCKDSSKTTTSPKRATKKTSSSKRRHYSFKKPKDCKPCTEQTSKKDVTICDSSQQTIPDDMQVCICGPTDLVEVTPECCVEPKCSTKKKPWSPKLPRYGLKKPCNAFLDQTKSCRISPSIPDDMQVCVCKPSDVVETTPVVPECPGAKTKKKPWSPKIPRYSLKKPQVCKPCAAPTKSSTCDDRHETVAPIDDGGPCVCGSPSEKMLVPWTPEDKMVARLSDLDGRTSTSGRNTIRVVSTLENKTSGRLTQQKVMTRIKISGVRLKKFLNSPQCSSSKR